MVCGEEEVDEVLDGDCVAALLLVVELIVCDEVLHLLALLVGAAGLVDLDEDAAERALCELTEEVVLGLGGLKGALGSEDGLAEEDGDDALAAALLAVEEDADAGLLMGALEEIGHPVEVPIGVGDVLVGDDAVDVVDDGLDECGDEGVVDGRKGGSCEALPEVVDIGAGAGGVDDDLCDLQRRNRAVSAVIAQ